MELNSYYLFIRRIKSKGLFSYSKKQRKISSGYLQQRWVSSGWKITDEGFFIRGLGELTNNGYVIVASQYRGNAGSEGIEEFGGKDVNDVLNLIPLASNIAQADTSRIGMFGWSRGEMMTYIALSKTKNIRAAVVLSGLPDLIKLLETRKDFDISVYAPLIPDYTKDKTRLLQERSATFFADKINKTTAILILQGTADWRVLTNLVLELVTRFYEVKQPFKFILYEGGKHALIEHRKDYVNQMINWFNIYLRDKTPVPSLTAHGE